MSTHRYEYGTFWPNLAESDFDHIGQREGQGYNINIPFNKVGQHRSHQVLHDNYLDRIKKCGLFIRIFQYHPSSGL